MKDELNLGKILLLWISIFLLGILIGNVTAPNQYKYYKDDSSIDISNSFEYLLASSSPDHFVHDGVKYTFTPAPVNGDFEEKQLALRGFVKIEQYLVKRDECIRLKGEIDMPFSSTMQDREVVCRFGTTTKSWGIVTEAKEGWK